MTERVISQSIKTEASRHSEERMKFEYNRFGLSAEQRKSMILIGTIGQLMFKEYIIEQDVPFEFEYQAGQYDSMDFKLGEDIVEIKTSGYDNSFRHLNLLYSQDQFDAGLRKNFKYCVQMFVNGYSKNTKLLDLFMCDKCTIAGYIPFERIQDFKKERQFYSDDYKIPLTILFDINNLINNYK